MKKLVIFGASGDLAKRKLMPSLSKIDTSNVQIIAYARSDLQNNYADELRKFYEYETNFPETVKYIQGKYDELSELKQIVDENTIYYFSVPPEIYQDLLIKMASLNFKTVGIEKPFGTSHESFLELACFKKERIHFIDHYLLKPLLVAMPTILYENEDLASLLNRDNIEYVEACFNETLLSEGRLYFEKTGMVKDVIQNHLMVALASILSPRHIAAGCDSDSIMRARIIENMKIDVSKSIYGQYKGYAEELGEPSNTETFACLSLSVADENWNNIPFILMAGKGLKEKKTQVSFTIRKQSHQRFMNLIKNFVHIENIKEMILSFNFSPFTEIFILIENRKYVIYSSSDIENIMSNKYAHFRDHEIVFEWLLKEKPFCSAGFEEVSALWKLFDETIGTPQSLIYYDTQVCLPAEVEKFICGVKKDLN